VTIKETIEAIKAMPEDAEFFVGRVFPSIGQTVQGYGNTNTIADLRELAEAYEALDLKVRKARTVIACGNDSHVIVRTIADVLFESHPRPVELSSGEYENDPRVRVTFPDPVEGQTGWSIPGVGNFDMKGNLVDSKKK
jgi:hypothetical protein